MRRADNLTTFMCRLSWNLGASTSWNSQGLSRAVMEFLYLYLYHWKVWIVQQFAVCKSILVQQYDDIWCGLQSTVQVKLPAILSCRSITLHNTEFPSQATALILTIWSLPVTWCTNSLTFTNCTLCPHCIYVFCIYLRTDSDLYHLQHKLIGFYNRDEKRLQRATHWVFK